jgi:uncharacterized protein
MFSERLTRQAITRSEIVPRYLDERDHPWLRALIDAYSRFEGRRRAELDQHLREPLAIYCPPAKKAQAISVLDKLCRDQTTSIIAPPKAREAVFTEAAQGGRQEDILARAGERFGIKASQILECLYADLPSERRIAALPETINASQLALRVNLALVQSMMATAQAVEITLYGNSRDIVRFAKLRGLLCTVRTSPAQSECEFVLDISGPFAIFKRTLVYARDLASLVPRLAWCDRFELRARCAFRDVERVVVIRSGDPIFPANEPRRFDSKVEDRFFNDFARLATDWDIIREPKPIPAAGTLIFPDFALIHRRDQNRCWLLEIVGYWTPDYLAKKLMLLRIAGLSNLILCIDEKRNCSEQDVQRFSHLVVYRNRIKPEQVLSMIDPDCSGE